MAQKNALKDVENIEDKDTLLSELNRAKRYVSDALDGMRLVKRDLKNYFVETGKIVTNE